MKLSTRFQFVLLALVALLVAWLAPGAWKSVGVLPLAFGTVLSDSDIARWLNAFGILDAAGGTKVRPPAPKTGNYNVVSPVTSAGDPSGTQFTNRGAGGAVTFTLPAVIPAMAGVYYDFLGVADQTFTVAGTAGQVVTFNNAAATSLACSTGGQKIGAHIRAVCDGISWHLIGDRIGVTYTVA